HLDEFAVCVISALLEHRRLRRTRTDHRIGALAENCANAAGSEDYGIRREGAQLHSAQVERRNAARRALRVDDSGEKLPALVLLHLAFGFITAHLLVES